MVIALRHLQKLGTCGTLQVLTGKKLRKLGEVFVRGVRQEWADAHAWPTDLLVSDRHGLVYK